MLQTSKNETDEGKTKENEQNEGKNETIRGNNEHGEHITEGNTISSENPDRVQHGGKNKREMTNRTEGHPRGQGTGHHDTDHRDLERLGTEQNGTKHHSIEHHDTGHHGRENGTDHHGSEQHGTDHHTTGHHDTDHHTTEQHGTDHHTIGQRDTGHGDDDKLNFQIENEFANKTSDGYQITQVVDSTQENIKHSADHSIASSGFESLNQSNNTHDIGRTETNFGVTMADKENLGTYQYNICYILL